MTNTIPEKYLKFVKVYRQALYKWGFNLQIDILIEECSEVIKSIIKLRRTHAWIMDASNKDKEKHKKLYPLIVSLVQELADADIMKEQILTHITDTWCNGFELFESEKQKKIQRLEERLKEVKQG